MNCEKPIQWTEDEAKVLRYATFAAEVLKRLTPPPPPEQSSSWWSRFVSFIQTTAGITLLTLVFGTFFGTLLTAVIQYYSKEREFQLEFQKGRNERALVALKEYTEHEQETTKQIYELIGRCVTVSEDLRDLTGPNFDRRKYPGIDKQIEGMLKAYNVCDDQWRNDGEKFGMLMSYYHTSAPSVAAAWENAQAAVTEYMDCSWDWYSNNNTKIVPESVLKGVCKPQRENVTAKMRTLNLSINGARMYLWKDLGLISGEQANSTPIASK